MQNGATPTPVPGPSPAALTQPPRLGLPIVLLAVYWVLYVIVGRLEKPYFIGFLYTMASAALLNLIFLTWWWANRRVRLADRLYGFLIVVGGAAVVEPLCHPSLGWFGVLCGGLPVVLTVWTAWMLLARRLAVPWSRLGLLVVMGLAWGYFTLLRVEGVNADLQADVRWRWAPSAEDVFLGETVPASESPDTRAAAWAPSLGPEDWTGFRGPDRDGVLRGVTLRTDWGRQSPRLVWRRRVGPAWSSAAQGPGSGRLLQGGDGPAPVDP